MSIGHDFNYLKKVMRHPCRNNRMDVVVTAAFRSAVPAIYDLASFGCREIMRQAAGSGVPREKIGNFRPKMFPKPHRAFKSGVGKIGGALAFDGFSAAFALEGLAERALFYWLIANVTADFFVNWTSLMYAENGCAGPPAGGGNIDIPPQTAGEALPYHMRLGRFTGEHGVVVGPDFFTILPGFSAAVSYHVPWHPWPPFPDPGAAVTTRLVRYGDGQVYSSSDWHAGDPNLTGTVGIAQDRLSGGLVSGESYAILAIPSLPISQCDIGQINITLTGHEVPLFNVTNCFQKK